MLERGGGGATDAGLGGEQQASADRNSGLHKT